MGKNCEFTFQILSSQGGVEEHVSGKYPRSKDTLDRQLTRKLPSVSIHEGNEGRSRISISNPEPGQRMHLLQNDAILETPGEYPIEGYLTCIMQQFPVIVILTIHSAIQGG